MSGGKTSKSPITDCHTHLKAHDAEAGTRLLNRALAAGIEAIAIAAVSELAGAGQNAVGLAAKARHPKRIFLFAGLDYSALTAEVDHRLTLSLGRQVERLLALGSDGVKMLTGKPNVRRARGIALDSPVYEGCFARLEALGMPLLWHVNDPEEFWDPRRAPEWATAPGWIYDERFPSKESLYGECGRVLERHPNLKVIFAHFYFLSADLKRAGELLDRYPQVCLDLAPGIEMFHNFSADVERAREFFVRHQDRILFGTDLVEDSPASRIEVVRRCLETADAFHVPTDEPLFWPDHRTTLRGLALPAEVLAKITHDNFRRVVGAEPRALDREAVRVELERLAAISDELGESPNVAREMGQALS